VTSGERKKNRVDSFCGFAFTRHSPLTTHFTATVGSGGMGDEADHHGSPHSADLPSCRGRSKAAKILPVKRRLTMLEKPVEMIPTSRVNATVTAKNSVLRRKRPIPC
jgi:hypothetical protein